LNKETKMYAGSYCGEKYTAAEELKEHVFKTHKGRSLPAPEGHIKLTINNDLVKLYAVLGGG